MAKKSPARLPMTSYQTPVAGVRTTVMSPNPSGRRLADSADDGYGAAAQVEEPAATQRSLAGAFDSGSTGTSPPNGPPSGSGISSSSSSGEDEADSEDLEPPEEEQEEQVPTTTKKKKPKPEEAAMEPLSGTFNIPRREHIKLKDMSNFRLWRNRLFTVLRGLGLDKIMLGEERLDRNWEPRKQQCWHSRYSKCLTVLNLSLDDAIVLDYDKYYADGDLLAMYKALVNDFGGRVARNGVLIHTDMYTRRMKPGEKVMDYINDLLKLHSELRQTGEDVHLDELAKIMMTNVSGDVFEDISVTYAQKAAKGVFPTFGEDPRLSW